MLAEIDAFRDYLQVVRRLSPHTLNGYHEDLLRFATFLEEQQLASWGATTQRHIRRYLGELQARGYARRSTARKLAAIRSFFRFLCRERSLAGNPAAGM